MPIPRTSKHRGPGAAALALVIAAGPLVACSSTQPIGEQLNDQAIAAKIDAKLIGDPDINPFKIDVDVDEGEVRLSGTVEKAAVKSEAERLARETSGVKKVFNDIQLGERSIPQRIDDSVLVAKVKTKLAADPDINPFNVNVDAEDGVVTLMGRVDNAGNRLKIAQIAADTNGVRRVVNRLKVGDRN